MLKKLILAAAVLAPASGSLNAAVVNKSPQEVKIYINPGHGGFNSNCRPMGTVKRGANVTTASTANDTTAFFESNTNLWKCLAMYYKLLDYGVPRHSGNALYDASKNQHIVMSRIKNGDSTDRGLSTDIAVEVEKFSPDIFISVHSNASPDGSIGTNENYPLVLYRGEDYRSTAFTDTDYGKNWDYAGTGLNGAGSSYELGKLVYSHLATIEHEPYTDEWKDQYISGYSPLKTEHNVRGDVNFMAWIDNECNGKSSTLTTNRGAGVTNTYSNKKYYGYYGVMKHGAVGVLSEGYMHSYYPSVNRHMNKDVCAIEGIAYAHAIADYFGWEKEKTGYIYGIVRDRNQTFWHEYYRPAAGTDDIYKPLNNCTVNLYKDGKLVDTYVTDDEWNGAFVFYDLEPGDYTLDYVCAGYQPASEGLKSTVVTVKANEISYPKAFLNATGYAMNSGQTFTQQWKQAFGSVGNGFWLQGAATTDGLGNETVYTVPAIQAIDDLYFISAANYPYTKGYSLRNGTVNFWSSGSTPSAFPAGTGSYYEFGPGIAADNAGTLWTPSIKGAGALSWADGIQAVAYYTVRPQYRSSGQDDAGDKSGINLKECKIGRSDLMSAYGDGINGSGNLWFCDQTNNKVVCVKLNKAGIDGEAIKYNAPETVVNRSLAVQYSDTEIMYNCGRGSSRKIYKGIINESAGTISWTDLGVTTVNNSNTYPSAGATMFRLAGNEYLAYSSATNAFTVKNITTGEEIVTNPGLTSASSYVNHSINAIVKDDNNADLFVYVPGANGGVVKYTLSVYNNPDDPVEIPAAAGEAVTAESNYENDITITWEKPDSWTEEPTNYLIKYQTYYTKDDGTIQYVDPNGGDTTSEYWHNLGMTEDATCRFVHEGAEFAYSKQSYKIYPLTYSYMIIPNFNCYDGEASVMSNTVTVGFVAPKPEMDEFAITADHDGVELNGYDGSVTWNGVDFTANNQFSLKGYKFELYNSKDNSTPVKSITFNANDGKYFGAIDNETGEGAMLDADGNAIENLTYSIVDGKKLFRYSVKDLDVLDIVDGEVNTNIFTAHVSAMFDIEGEFVYSDESVKKVKPYQYELKAPGTTAKVGTFKTGQTDAEGNTFDTYWVEMNITEPDYGDAEAIPVSHYLISMDKDKDGVADEYASMLYVYDAAESLGIKLETGEGIDNNAIITGVSTMSLRSTTSPAQLPGTYDFGQTIPSGESMVSFPVNVASGSSDNPKEYQYSVEAVYAAGNAEITSVTSTTVSNPIDSGTVTGVETVGIDGNPALSVYPVPATMSVTVKSSEAIAKVAIYSGAGVLVKALEGNGAGVMTVNVSDLEEGVYFLHVNSLDPVKVVKK